MSPCYAPRVFGLTGGEWFVVGVLFFGIVSASWWPRVGAWIAERLGGANSGEDSDSRNE